MKIQLITPFKMQWLDGYVKVFKNDDLVITSKPIDEDTDVFLFMWCNQDTVDFINKNKKKGKYIVWVRRYEYYTQFPDLLDWKKVDHVVCVNRFFAANLETRINKSVHLVYNGIDTSKWDFEERTSGNKIAIVGYVNQKKNFPLALQILAALPQEYSLHIAGDYQDMQVVDYILNLGRTLEREIYLDGEIPNINSWLEDKNYLLSCAISEGNPNNVLEAMAKGIKPVVHNWPGSEDQIPPDLRFSTVAEATQIIRDKKYESNRYKSIIDMFHGENQFKAIHKLIQEK